MSDLSDCTKCKVACQNNPSGVDTRSCMQAKCPQCIGPNPSTLGVCANQSTFNKSFHNAIKWTNKKEQGPVWVQWIAFCIYILLALWALMLVSKMPAGNDRKIHYMFALVFPPIYIISYYVGMSSNA